MQDLEKLIVGSDTIKIRGVFESALVALCEAWDVFDETETASNRELDAREVLKNMCAVIVEHCNEGG